MRLGDGATLTFPGIDQPSTLIISHFLPTTAFIQSRNDSSEASSSSTSLRRSKRKRSSTKSTPVFNPNVYSRGRYIKMNQAEKGQPNDFVVGVLLSKVEHRKKERWNVQFGNNEMQLLATEFENAFPPGQRVLVNWQGSGKMLQGCVVVWDGGGFHHTTLLCMLHLSQEHCTYALRCRGDRCFLRMSSPAPSTPL